MICVGLSIYCFDLKRVRGVVPVAIPCMTVRDCKRAVVMFRSAPQSMKYLSARFDCVCVIFGCPSAVFVRTVVKGKKRGRKKENLYSL
ncbi:hypothetical protein IscW_ISCW013448 [Ixodes scapularis]|uniref:Uncharacterized protein n=1 Tax=Ixodes scapularis TaxID=6945 RepID=B7QEN1_IXOSC|nr:hypothetical protein IscW_ISCW013448 [Ixodes scapularis]|eukprot:XP_002413995.1 hypothetical protein IscW_ISCW013448 [Ixodes scapularis]